MMRVPATSWSIFPAALCVLLGVAPVCADVKHLQSDESTEIAFLVRRGTADSLATASLLAHLTQVPDEEPATGAPPGPDSSQLIQRAVSLAPKRPELVWLQLRVCQSRRCEDEQQIAVRLKELDPDNGLAWLGDLNAAQAKSAEDVTQVIERMGAPPGPRIYWNALAVMMFDALTHRDRAPPPTALTQHADDRLMHVTGVLAGVNVPAFRPLAYACGSAQFVVTGRRAACANAMVRLETSDAVVTQLFRLSVQQGWCPAGSPEAAVLRREWLQRRYLTVASNRLRKGHADRDAEMRVDAMRRLPREEDVERVMLTAFHEPLEAPAGWHIPAAAE